MQRLQGRLWMSSQSHQSVIDIASSVDAVTTIDLAIAASCNVASPLDLSPFKYGIITANYKVSIKLSFYHTIVPFLFVCQYEACHYIICLVHHCINQCIYLRDFLLFVQRRCEAEPLKSANPFRPFNRFFERERFFFCTFSPCISLFLLSRMFCVDFWHHVVYRPILTTDMNTVSVTLCGLIPTARVSHFPASPLYRGRRATSYQER